MSDERCHETRGYCRCDKARGHVTDGDKQHHCPECDHLPHAYSLAFWQTTSVPGWFRAQESLCVTRTKRYPADDPWHDGTIRAEVAAQ